MYTVQQLRLIVFLGIFAAMAPLATDMYLPALPEMQRMFNTDMAQIQMTLTMTMLGMALGQIVAGPMSDMRGRKLPLFLGTVIFSLASLVCVVIDNIQVFLAARFVQGLSGAYGIVIARAIARDVCDKSELTRFFSILMMVNGLAPILAPVIGGQLLKISTWHSIFVLLCIIGVIMSVATLFFKETLPEEKRLKGTGNIFSIFPRLLQNSYFRGHFLLQSFVFMSFFCYISSSSFVFQGIYGVSAQEYSLIFGGIGAGLMVTGTIPAKLAGRVSEEKLLKYTLRAHMLGAALLLVGFFVEASLPFIIMFTALSIVPLSVFGAVSFSLAMGGQGKNAGSASALLGFASMFLGGLMMPCVGYLGMDSGIPMGMIMLLGYTLAYLCFHFFLQGKNG